MKVTISATWLRLPWQMQQWDRAYQYVISAGGGDHAARTELAHVKLAAQANNPAAKAVKANFDAVAKLVTEHVADRAAGPAQGGGAVAATAAAALAPAGTAAFAAPMVATELRSLGHLLRTKTDRVYLRRWR